MEDEKKYYRYEFVFDTKTLDIREMDSYDNYRMQNEILNETGVFVNNHGVYEFYMYSESKDNVDMFLSQISKILSQEAQNASRLYHLANGRFIAFGCFRKKYNRIEDISTNKELRDIILAKCNEREQMGYDSLTDSDIMDILEECERKNIPVTLKELEQLGMD